MIDLAQANLNDGGGQYVEETFYYGGLAREGWGRTTARSTISTARLPSTPISPRRASPAMRCSRRWAANGVRLEPSLAASNLTPT